MGGWGGGPWGNGSGLVSEVELGLISKLEFGIRQKGCQGDRCTPGGPEPVCSGLALVILMVLRLHRHAGVRLGLPPMCLVSLTMVPFPHCLTE